jgi:hypothetical protein
MIDALGIEVAGLAGALTIEISKAGGAFAPDAGAQGEIGDGWYYYDLTAGETDTLGPLSVKIEGAGALQQNLEYIILSRNVGCTPYTYTVTDSVTLQPIPGVQVWFSTDLAGTNVVWSGYTDAFGVARDAGNNLPCIDPGTYYVWLQKVGFTPDAYPDIEVVP